ncbi:DNA (cytosine-5-)-methyltransferase [Candidatus Bathyarchaeota archaeon]|nr:DNA (cytosine-5-)-methyltransferase [Candidatus Bathyarchaeota archaeon]
MKFIDLFAGLGGFHLALKQLGHQCVFASEINPTLKELYSDNFGLEPKGDLRQVNVEKIPKHDILCAGFPCQPFSKAGPRDGLENPKLGKLYREILKVITYHHPKYFILENVPNLEKHNNGQTWKYMKNLLIEKGYNVLMGKLSPHQFGIPQIRERLYIVGSTDNLTNFKWPKPDKLCWLGSIEKYLDKNPHNFRKLSEPVNRCLDVWQDFLNNVPADEKIPHPLWSTEFGATYPYEGITPKKMTYHDLKQFCGSHGKSLENAQDLDQLFSFLPSYTRRDQDVFPKWKINIIRKNRDFYKKHKNWLDVWIPKILEFPSSWQKLEWNCQGESDRNIRHYIIQMRPSGVRVKRRTTIPSLVAMTPTQVPIIAWENRYVTPCECLKLQSMDGPNGLLKIPEKTTKAYKALGNAVNVKVAILVAKALFCNETKFSNKMKIRNKRLVSS